MDPQTVFCPNSACYARGHIGRGNIRVHSREKRRYVCDECGSTFVATKGIVFYRRRLSKDIIVKIITLLAHGCPRQAIVVAFEVDERTVKSLEKNSGNHCQQVHEHLVEQPRDLGQVQGDELYAKVQGCILWLAMAIQVQTRLWLGGELSISRSKGLITKLIQRVRRCALCRPLLFCVDGYKAYVGAIQRVFREPVRDSKTGRPRLRPWDGVHIAQVVKQYARKRVVGVTRRVVQGSWTQIGILIQKTQGAGVINTTYIVL